MLEVDEEWGRKLWDAVKFSQDVEIDGDKPPLVEVDFDQKTLELELHFDYNDEESESSERIQTLKEYKDIFAWSYRDLKGVDPAIYQHTIPMKEDVKPCK